MQTTPGPNIQTVPKGKSEKKNKEENRDEMRRDDGWKGGKREGSSQPESEQTEDAGKQKFELNLLRIIVVIGLDSCVRENPETRSDEHPR